MNRLKKLILFLICAALLVLPVLVGCSCNDNGKATYSIYVTSMGGLGLQDVSVTVTSSDSKVASGKTDKNGKYTFSAEKGVYDVAVDNLPLGYKLDDANVYKTSADKLSLLIHATSSVIKDTIPSDKIYKQGDVIYDFSITDETDRNNPVTYTLSTVLESKRMVLLNFWNTNCGPCVEEMPDLELVYREFKSQAEVFGIDVPLLGVDRIANIRQYRNATYYDDDMNPYSLTYPLAIDDNEMPYHFAMDAIPVSVVVDRYGVIALIHVGGMDRPTFRKLFEKYTSDNYVQDKLPDEENPDKPKDELEREKPNVSQPASSEIEAAINGTGFTGSYYPETETDDAEYSWPWLVGETNNEKYIYPANTGVNYSFATIYTKVNISAADIADENGKVVLAFDLQWACENLYDYFYVIVNNSLVYEYTGTEQWGKWQSCFALVATEPGEYVLCLMFVKDEQQSEGADTVRIKNMRMLSIPQIDIPSLDMPREAARDWDGNDFNTYVSVVKDADGFYHMGSADGPYILAELMGVSAFNKRLTTSWGISEFAINGYFNYNTTDDTDDPNYNPDLDDTDAITVWAQAANNSELYGLTLINDELKALLEKFIKTQVGNKYNDKMWLEYCRYFDHYGTDKSDAGINRPERNPIRGLLNSTAVPTVAPYDGELDLNNIPNEYKNKVLLTRLIVPRGFKYLFVPEQDGVYRFRSQSKELSDTMAWLSEYDAPAEVYLATSDSQLENPDETYNFIITYYLKAGEKYILATCFADMYGTGEYTFTVEYLGPTYYAWQFAASNLFTTTDDSMTQVTNIMYVQPVLGDDGIYYNAKKNANGQYIKVNGEYVANTNDPIYVDFLTGARFFEYGSLELVFTYSDRNQVIKTLNDIFARVWNKTKPSGGWTERNGLAEIKGTALNEDDWISILTEIFNTYGDTAYIDGDAMLAAVTSRGTVGELADFLINFYLNLYDQTFILYDDKYNIDPDRYKDYTPLIRQYYNDAKANTGDPNRRYADKGCVKLTEPLRDALDMFCKRVGGFPELDTDWLRLCAHYEYFGPAE
ncbi:MAG: TlpA family protein disulfide reductase [Clostridiales bacterium]|nr:TlpA family protein disulfide reductase [Clostridiales bacterium]